MNGVTLMHPRALALLACLIPAVIICLVQFRRIVKNCALTDTGPARHIMKLRRRIKIRIFCWSLAWINLCVALAGPAWGTRLIPVQKSGAAVAFVFDISYSMEALDTPYEGVTRLEAASQYADSLLDHMSDTAVSAILAKGDGVIAVPLTEDMNAVRSLISSLSPTLMTAQGSSLGKGIDAAIRSFPVQTGRHSSIVVFTDGEETDGTLIKAADNALKSGISVVFVGFGLPVETTVYAGDGITPVKTALRENDLKSVVSKVNGSLRASSVTAEYIPATEIGSAVKLLKTICPHSVTGGGIETGYEQQPEERYPLFLGLALAFLAFGFICSEWHVKPQLVPLLLICLYIPLMSGCSGSLKNANTVLKSTLQWYRKNYQEATAGFLEVTENAEAAKDEILKQYGLYGLSSAYLMQEENDAALERIREISVDAPDEVRFSAWYNTGIIAHKKGDYEAAAHAFKEALLIDNTNVDAKINLELSLSRDSGNSKSVEQAMNPVSQTEHDSTRQDVIFSVIREDEQSKWKSPETVSDESSQLDY